MMASVNKVILVGRLGADPEMRSFQNGDQIANATLATTDRWKNKQTGEPGEHTEWHRLVFSGRLAEIAGQYLRKGSQVYVEGSIRTRKWQDQQTGQERSSAEIRVDQLQMLGGRRDSAVGETSAPPAAQPAPRPATRAAQPAPQSARAPGTGTPGQGSGFDDMDDDIPF